MEKRIPYELVARQVQEALSLKRHWLQGLREPPMLGVAPSEISFRIWSGTNTHRPAILAEILRDANSTIDNALHESDDSKRAVAMREAVLAAQVGANRDPYLIPPVDAVCALLEAEIALLEGGRLVMGWRMTPKPRVFRSWKARFADEAFQQLQQYGHYIDCEKPPAILLQDARDYVASLFDEWPWLALPRIDFDREGSPGIVVTFALSNGVTSILRFSGSDIRLTKSEALAYDGDFRDLERVGKWIMNGASE